MIGRARVALLEGCWGEAASLFTKLLRTGEPRNRAVAALGLLCSVVRTTWSALLALWADILFHLADIWPHTVGTYSQSWTK